MEKQAKRDTKMSIVTATRDHVAQTTFSKELVSTQGFFRGQGGGVMVRVGGPRASPMASRVPLVHALRWSVSLW